MAIKKCQSMHYLNRQLRHRRGIVYIDILRSQAQQTIQQGSLHKQAPVFSNLGIVTSSVVKREQVTTQMQKENSACLPRLTRSTSSPVAGVGGYEMKQEGHQREQKSVQ